MVSKANNLLATVVACIALFVALVGNAATLAFSEKATATACKYAQENRDKIREQIRANDPRLLKPGDPGFAYYRDNPEEKAKAVIAISDSLDRFPVIDCT